MLYQKKSWKLHKEECTGFQHIAPHIPKDAVVLLLRLILRLNVRFIIHVLLIDLFININANLFSIQIG